MPGSGPRWFRTGFLPSDVSVLPASLVAGATGGLLAFCLSLPAWLSFLPLFAFACVLALQRSGRTMAAGLGICVGVSWTLLVLHAGLADRLDPQWIGSTRTLEGYVRGLPERHPDYTRFRFQPSGQSTGVPLPDEILAYWYRDAPELKAGELWQIDVSLRPPWGQVNFQGNDRERWFFADGIGGLATVQIGTRLEPARAWQSGWNGLRETARERIREAVPDERNRGIVTALAIADVSGMDTRDREVFAATGTAHLMAISGLNVGMAAWCGFWLARLLLLLVPIRWLKGQSFALALGAGLVAAFFYSGLAGFGTATVRALLMLAVGMLVLLRKRQVHPGQALLLALAGILLFDPLAPLAAGFWLSFGAVGVLIYLFSGSSAGQPERFPGRWRQLVQAQLGIMLVLLPLSAFWFQQFSLSGLVVNLVAIPWVSFLLVPLVLSGLLFLPLFEPLSASAFTLAGLASGGMMQVLDFCAGWPHSAVALAQPAIGPLIVASLGALLLLLPRGLPHRWLGLVLMLPIFIGPPSPAGGELQVDVLDVGQGTAVLVSSDQHLLLYDTGPGDGKDYDQVKQVIQPAILNSGHRAPDRIIVSHGDLDHAGGLQRLLALYPSAEVNANLRKPLPGVAPCVDSLRWAWDDMGFAVLHPSIHLPYLANDSSCVLDIRKGTGTILLPGDISTAIEQRLVKQGLSHGGILLVPHHGSKGSSSEEFLHGLRPSLAVATTGIGNRFGFPRPEVQERFRSAGIPFSSTSSCGALRIWITRSGQVQVTSARKERAAPWRWPAGPDCP